MSLTLADISQLAWSDVSVSISPLSLMLSSSVLGNLLTEQNPQQSVSNEVLPTNVCAPVQPGASTAGTSANRESVATASFLRRMLRAGFGDLRVWLALGPHATEAAF